MTETASPKRRLDWPTAGCLLLTYIVIGLDLVSISGSWIGLISLAASGVIGTLGALSANGRRASRSLPMTAGNRVLVWIGLAVMLASGLVAVIRGVQTIGDHTAFATVLLILGAALIVIAGSLATFSERARRRRAGRATS